MSYYKDKTILVTGAGGSIGSELCVQLAAQNPKNLILFDSSELALYNIDRKVKGVPVLGDVSDSGEVNNLFSRFAPIDVIFHAAAYKHVTLCEKNAVSAARVNVYGTQLLTRTAKVYGVPKLILVSTDKAVNPTCVMGATKKAAEDIVKDYNYTTVRLGNVWGSSGSVVPLWKEQIAAGSPVTITHPEATRYFISVFDAAKTILIAGHRGVGGDTFVANMGDPVNMVDVARRLGATEFTYIGLRPGEKLHEELFAYPHSPYKGAYCALYQDAA